MNVLCFENGLQGKQNMLIIWKNFGVKIILLQVGKHRKLGHLKRVLVYLQLIILLSKVQEILV